MKNVVTHVLESDLSVIGQNLDALTRTYPFDVSVEDTEAVVAVKLNHRNAKGADGKPATGAAEFEAVGNALSMSTLKDQGGTWVLDETVFPNNVDDIEKMCDVKFVFEKANEKIIVIAHQHALDYAKQDAPFEEGDYTRMHAQTFAKQVLQNVLDNWNDADLAGDGKTAVAKIIEKAIDREFPTLTNDQELAILYEQLGSYTCRQCG